jgi:uncharacterized YigZ family protein
MPNTDKYKTIELFSEGVYKEKGSKFISLAYPVSTEQEVKDIIKTLRKKYYDARHIVYAYRLGADMKILRCSDDGEPANSSGPPVLGQIQTFGLTYILIAVVRYFGGTKLGVSGLINAYKTSAKDAIENNTIIEKYEQDVFTIEFDYSVMNTVMKLLKENSIEQSNQQFDNVCKITISIRKLHSEKIKELLSKIEKLKFS